MKALIAVLVAAVVGLGVALAVVAADDDIAEHELEHDHAEHDDDPVDHDDQPDHHELDQFDDDHDHAADYDHELDHRAAGHRRPRRP